MDTEKNSPVGSSGRGVSVLGKAAWCMYDWANSAFPTIIVTFLFFSYYETWFFADAAIIDGQDSRASLLWGQMLALTGICIAVLSPLMGAIADRTGRRKPWLMITTAGMVLLTGSLFFLRPQGADGVIFEGAEILVLGLVAIAVIFAELSAVFYNAMLPGIARENEIGRLSGWGWGLGYMGGIAILAIANFVFISPDPPLFGMDDAVGEPERAVFLLTALWIGLFALPLFLFTPDIMRGVTEKEKKIGIGQAVRDGVSQLIASVKAVRKFINLVKFLIASAIYRDGLATLFAMGIVFARDTYKMETSEILIFGLMLNVSAGLGAFIFGWVDDKIGPKKTVMISLVALILCGLPILLIDSKTLFVWAALPMGLFVGPTQAASRSFLAHIVPEGMTTEAFGLYALSGKAVAFLGPAAFTAVVAFTHSTRAGMATIFAFFICGAALLWFVREERPAANIHDLHVGED